jgi:hypothetical protein
MRSTPSFITERTRDLAAMAAAYRVGLAASLAAWPVLLGRAIFYGVCLMVLVAFWDKVAAARLPGTLATRLPPGGLGVYIGVTEWITLSIPARPCSCAWKTTSAPAPWSRISCGPSPTCCSCWRARRAR